jgi:hypothetical protein
MKINIYMFHHLRKFVLILGGFLLAAVVTLIWNLIIQTKYTEKFNSVLNVNISKTHIPFISNEGQLDENVKYYAQTFSGTVFITENGEIFYSFPMTVEDNNGKGFVIKEELVDKQVVNSLGVDRTLTKTSYIKGNDKAKWISNIPTYNRVTLGEVYNGIELSLKAYGNNVEKLFFVQPGANPDIIKVGVTGIEYLSTNNSGELILESPVGSVSFTKPVAYQELPDGICDVEVAYKVEGKEYGFEVENYNKYYPLIIDPLLASTFIGGSNTDDSYEPSIALDDNGNVYLTGYTFSTDFPTTLGAYKEDFNGGSTDRFISKFDSDLTTLLASTFIGGSGNEYGMGIKISGDNDIYLAGYTTSIDFPTTIGAYNEIHSGARDAFVLKIDNDLTTLLRSTFLGGSGDEGFNWPRIDLTIGENGSVYVTGLTKSVNFPFTTGTNDSIYSGGTFGGDVFISKFDSTLGTLLGSTYLGGSMDEWRISIALDENENVFVCGETESQNFETTPGTYNAAHNGGSDIFISKFTNDLTTLSASTFFGKSNYEEALAIRLDGNENVVITGYTKSSNFPTTAGAYNQVYYGGERDAYVAKFDNNLTSLLASTFLGGSGKDTGEDIIIDGNGNIYVVGVTLSSDFQTITGAYDESHNGGEDIFVSKFNGSLSTLIASTLLGESSNDKGQCISLDNTGNVYFAGTTASVNFPFTQGAYDTIYNSGSNDCFVAKFDSTLSAIATSFEEKKQQPNEFALYNNFPNPFNPATTISFQIPSSSKVTLKIYDLLGSEILILLDEEIQAGNYSLGFDASDLAGGIYYYKLKAGSFSDTKKMILLK